MSNQTRTDETELTLAAVRQVCKELNIDLDEFAGCMVSAYMFSNWKFREACLKGYDNYKRNMPGFLLDIDAIATRIGRLNKELIEASRWASKEKKDE